MSNRCVFLSGTRGSVDWRCGASSFGGDDGGTAAVALPSSGISPPSSLTSAPWHQWGLWGVCDCAVVCACWRLPSSLAPPTFSLLLWCGHSLWGPDHTTLLSFFKSAHTGKTHCWTYSFVFLKSPPPTGPFICVSLPAPEGVWRAFDRLLEWWSPNLLPPLFLSAFS